MTWNDMREISREVELDNKRSNIIVTMKLQPQGLLISSDHSAGFFAYQASKIIAYWELDERVDMRGLVMSHVNEVRASIQHHTKTRREG